MNVRTKRALKRAAELAQKEGYLIWGFYLEKKSDRLTPFTCSEMTCSAAKITHGLVVKTTLMALKSMTGFDYLPCTPIQQDELVQDNTPKIILTN